MINDNELNQTNENIEPTNVGSNTPVGETTINNNVINNQVEANIPVGEIPTDNNDINNQVEATPINSVAQEQPISVEINQEIPNQNLNNVTNEVVTSTPITDNASNIPKKKNTKILIPIIIVVIALLVVAIIFVVKKPNQKSKQKTKEQQIAEIFGENQLIIIKKDNKYGCIDANGDEVIPPKYYSLTPFYGDYAIAIEAIEKDGRSEFKRAFIDKKGEVKLNLENEGGVEFFDDLNLWRSGDDVYSIDLKKLNPENTKFRNDIEDGYVILNNNAETKAFIMNTEGKIIFEYNLLEGESYVSISKSKNDPQFTENYCRINIENEKYGIINCDTGKIIYEITTNYISSADNNIFGISEKEPYKFIEEFYIFNDKILYSTRDSKIDIDHYINENYIRVIDNNKPYEERYTYINIKTGEFAYTTPKDIQTVNNEKVETWYSYTKSSEKYCDDNKRGIIKEGKEEKQLVPCEYDDFEYLNLDVYKFLESKGKQYVLGEKDDKTYLINLKTGKAIKEFDTTNIIKEYSTFIYYYDKDNHKKIYVYNMLTNKEKSFDDGLIYVFPSYFTIKKDKVITCYNTNLKEIYSEKTLY